MVKKRPKNNQNVYREEKLIVAYTSNMDRKLVSSLISINLFTDTVTGIRM